MTPATPTKRSFMVPTQRGSVLYVCTQFEADSSFRSKVIRGSQNFEIGSRVPGHAHLGVVLFFVRRRVPFSVSVPNLKRIAQFVQKLLRGSRNSEVLSSMSVPNFEIFRSKVIRGSQISPRRRPPDLYLQTQFGEDRCTPF